MFKQFALLTLGLAVALLAFSAGAAWLVADLQTPDSVHTVQRIRADAITGHEAQTARTLAEADRTRAEAEAVTSAAFMQSASAALGLVACVGVMAVVISGAAWLTSRNQD